ncbi:MAG: pilus assembly protein N-terminal domain-containing protein [Pseudomonadota bacterium]
MCKQYRFKMFILTLSLAIGGLAMTSLEAHAEKSVRQIFRVMLDEARLLRLDVPVQTLIIGNSAIADALVNDGRTIIVTAKAYGSTNLIALNNKGEIIAERQIEVQQPDPSILTVQRGTARESYSCTPKCMPTPVLGDSKEHFDGTIGQSNSRNSWAQGGAK